MRDGQPIKGVVASVQDSNEAVAHLLVKVAPDTPLGPAQLLVTRRGYQEVVAEIRVVEPSEFALEADTVGLWHLNEGAEAGAHLIDNGERAINLTGAQNARVAEGWRSVPARCRDGQPAQNAARQSNLHRVQRPAC